MQKHAHVSDDVGSRSTRSSFPSLQQDQRDKRHLGSAKGFHHNGLGLQWPESQSRCVKADKGSVIILIESNDDNL
jgi:hypothetical protein